MSRGTKPDRTGSNEAWSSLVTVVPKVYTSEDQETWREILSAHRKIRDRQICEIFLRGVEILGLREDRIPDLEDVNRILLERTGFRGVLVDGLEEGSRFYHMLARREFPVGNFIRDRKDLSY
ncbi:MAG: hypothetical protein HC902_13135, partial [Calothrix sp. SM1_5_4]|nr:hypothetical protein [Calothrix sp. SM1_5_4]